MRLTPDPLPTELLAEEIHYRIVGEIAPNNRFNAIKYLYDRLNIIDAKAQGLLTRNGLLLTTVSIIASTQIGKVYPFLYHPLAQFGFVIAYLLLVTSTVITFPIMRLRFDNLTVVPEAAKTQLAAACGCADKDPARCVTDPACDHRRLLARIGELTEADAREARWFGRSGRCLEEYEKTFFALTVKRQAQLRRAQDCTIWASYLFFAVILYIFVMAIFAPPPVKP